MGASLCHMSVYICAPRAIILLCWLATLEPLPVMPWGPCMQAIAHQYPQAEDQAVSLSEQSCAKLHKGRMEPCIFLKWRVHLSTVHPGTALWEVLTMDVQPDLEVNPDGYDMQDAYVGLTGAPYDQSAIY